MMCPTIEPLPNPVFAPPLYGPWVGLALIAIVSAWLLSYQTFFQPLPASGTKRSISWLHGSGGVAILLGLLLFERTISWDRALSAWMNRQFSHFEAPACSALLPTLIRTYHDAQASQNSVLVIAELCVLIGIGLVFVRSILYRRVQRR